MKRTLYRFPIYLIVTLLYYALVNLTNLSAGKLWFVWLLLPIYYCIVAALPKDEAPKKEESQEKADDWKVF